MSWLHCEKHTVKQWRNGETCNGEQLFCFSDEEDNPKLSRETLSGFSKDLALFYSLPKCVIHMTLPEKNTLSTFPMKTHTFPINHSIVKQFSADSCTKLSALNLQFLSFLWRLVLQCCSQQRQK